MGPNSLGFINLGKNVDGVLVIYTPTYATNPVEIAEAAVTAAGDYPYKPVFTTWMGEDQVLKAREFLSNKGIPTFVSTEQAVKSFIYMYRYDYNLRLLLETPEVILKDFEPDEYKAEEVIRKAAEDKRLILNFHEAEEIFRHYGLPVISTRKAATEEEAVAISDVLGYPVVLKFDLNLGWPGSHLCGHRMGHKKPARLEIYDILNV